MGSKTQKTETVRARKSAPNKTNLKTEKKRLRENIEILSKLGRKEAEKK